jgi:hypothetical protein
MHELRSSTSQIYLTRTFTRCYSTAARRLAGAWARDDEALALLERASSGGLDSGRNNGDDGDEGSGKAHGT